MGEVKNILKGNECGENKNVHIRNLVFKYTNREVPALNATKGYGGYSGWVILRYNHIAIFAERVLGGDSASAFSRALFFTEG